jgi:hypothetical protein
MNMTKKTPAFFSVFLAVFVLNAQQRSTASSEESGAETNLASASIGTSVSTSSDPAMDEQARDALNRFQEYRRFSFKKMYPLCAEGKKQGITASDEEVAAQEKALNAMFPGISVSKQMARDEVIARKYARTLPGTQPSEKTVQNAYIQFQKDFPGGTAPPLSDLQPILETRALVEHPIIQATVQELSKRQEEEINRRLIASKETWSEEEMRIRGPSDQCLAQHRDSAHCLLTVKKYNEMVRYHTIAKHVPLDSARVDAIRNILTDWYIAGEARAAGFAASDSADQEKKGFMRLFVERMKYGKIGRRVADRTTLWRTYSTYYDAIFKTRHYPYFSILGSTDSAAVDSLSRIRDQSVMKDSNVDAKKSARPDIDSSIPWSHSRGRELPDEFSGSIDTLRIGSVTGSIRTPYGFFLLRLDSVHTRYEIPFQEAAYQLVLLASKQKYLGMDSMLLQKAHSMYVSDKHLNRLPDTLVVKAVLTPQAPTDSLKTGKTTVVKGARKGKAGDIPAKAVTVSSALLPPDVRDSLLDRYETVQKKNATIGPVFSRFGVWYFRVLDRKPGGGERPFASVRKQLIDSLVVDELDGNADTLYQKPDSAFEEAALANSYAPRFFGTNDDVQEQPQSSNALEETRQRKIQARNAEIEAWFSKITIHPIAVTNNARN